MSWSLTQSEYMATTSTACHAVWLRRLLVDLTHEEEEPTPTFHRKSKHTDTKFHFIRELLMNGEISLQFCKSQDQLADIFTKSLARDSFEFLKQ